MVAVAFTGQDGTGKSTQMERLRAALEREGLSVQVVHQYGPTTGLGRLVAPLAKRTANRMKRGRLSATASGRGRRRGPLHAVAAWASLVVGWARSTGNRLRHRGTDVLILDRCFADEIVRAAHKFGRVSRFGLWLLRRTVPRPQVVFRFTLDPETGWRRKKTREMSLDEYVEKTAFVDETLERVAAHWPIVTVPVDGRDADQVFVDVWNHVRRQLAGR